MNSTIDTLLTRRSIRQIFRRRCARRIRSTHACRGNECAIRRESTPLGIFSSFAKKESLDQLATMHSGTRYIADAALAIVVFC